ncbi:sugar phosphate isomerase/epimerase [Chryseolinea sp. T2]|uniref:sugar phosphate isomerase/epimerase family protein n=1 Tax=Chryseolinea sp. T2 TaxID=3129255 RepID=UPI003077FA3C
MIKKSLLTAGLLIAAFLVSISFHNTEAQAIGMQMGTMREMYKDGMPAVFAKLKELGVTELEGGGGRGNREEFKKLVKDYGMKLVVTGAGFDKLENPDSLRKVIANAKDLGVPYVVCYWIPHDGDNFTFADAKKGVEVFNAAGKVLAENGIGLWYHAHGYEFRPYEGGKGTLFEYIMDNTNPKYVNLQMDVFWMKNPGQDPVALLKKYPTRWKSLHLKDRRIGTPNNLNGRQDKETNVVLGTGDVGIEAVMKTAVGLGIKHFFIEDESSRALAQVPQHIAFLKSIKY